METCTLCGTELKLVAPGRWVCPGCKSKVFIPREIGKVTGQRPHHVLPGHRGAIAMASGRDTDRAAAGEWRAEVSTIIWGEPFPEFESLPSAADVERAIVAGNQQQGVNVEDVERCEYNRKSPRRCECPGSGRHLLPLGNDNE